MKVFPKLAQRTNLDENELKVYYSIRFTYIYPFNERTQAHEQNLLSLAMVLLRAGKIRFDLESEEESKSSLDRVGVQFTHEASSVTVEEENKVMDSLKST
mmetsp:Transcript_12314/g.16701  ORF Transcript_12314/g.16701 Transcript_12314/m.16701 type:complete len:100 (+) Transcript_12314:357-656(+)